MAKIGIVYFSGQGNTAKLAAAVERGAQSVAGAQVFTHRISPEEIQNGRWKAEGVLDELSACDAIVFGAPVYMGGPAAQFKAFADATGGIWFKLGWKDKLAGGFACGGSPAGGKELTLTYLTALAGEHGMIWISSGTLPGAYVGENTNAYGYFYGAGAVGGNGPDENLPNEGDLKTGENYGARVAQLAVKMVG